jgi:hypothetical protein
MQDTEQKRPANVHPVTLSFYYIRAQEWLQVDLAENLPAYWGGRFPGIVAWVCHSRRPLPARLYA